MLRITANLFSGRPNPTWIVTSDEAEGLLIAALRESPELYARPGAGFDGLGYREVVVSRLGDDDRQRSGVPHEFALGTSAARNLEGSGQLARQLVEAMPSHADVRLPSHDFTPPTTEIRDLVLEHLDRFLHHRPVRRRPPPLRRTNPLRTTVHDNRCENCTYEVSQFNPSFWNRPEVQPHNNCYNYARNWRTDTFAQPGRAHGAMYGALACPDVTNAALADGLQHRCECLPDSEYPRRMVALVVGPGYDYHWYREQRGGFWGHKPGSTAARNYDNSSALITDPETCDRGPYSDFCGYFYAGRSVVIS